MSLEQENKNSIQPDTSAHQDSPYSILLSRRSFLYGALGVGALAIASSHIAVPKPAFADDAALSVLSVPTEAVFTLDDCSEVPYTNVLSLEGKFELPYGTLLWTSNDTIAACLFPTENSKPLTQLGMLNLANGTTDVLMKTSIGTEEGFDIYDVRASTKGFVWTEANVLTGIWRIYTATYASGTLDEALLVDEGTNSWETPTIAAVGSHAFWQVLPRITGDRATENSVLKRVAFGSQENEVIYSSEGRMSSPPYSLEDKLVITPRTSTNAVHHQLTLIDAISASTIDSLVLPQSMKPLEAGYGMTGFCFSFDGIYDYGEGISNLGTYTPQTAHETYDYQSKTWLRFNKTPSSPPAWCKNHFIVKSTRSVCGVDLDNKLFYAIDVEDGSDDYGDYLASTGMNSHVVTFANIHTKPLDGKEEKYCLVRVWTPQS